MKIFLFGLFIFVIVFSVSAALPEDNGRDRHSLLDPDSNQENDKPLQKKRPPVKVPGPKLRKTEDEENPNPSLTDDDSKIKQLSDESKGKEKKKKNLTNDNKNADFVSLDDDSKKGEKGRKGKGKDKDLIKSDENNRDNEETH